MNNSNEIKKALYKEKPIARYQKTIGLETDNPIHIYKCQTSLGYHYFNIPDSEMGDNKFNLREMAQYLIRWIVKDEQ